MSEAFSQARTSICKLVCALLVSCSYKSPYSLHSTSQSLSVPYIQQDLTGTLTGLIVEEIAKTNLYPISTKSGDLQLIVDHLETEDRDIGFRYADDPKKDNSKRLLVSERRLVLHVTVTLKERKTNKVILGPTRISTAFAYDFDPDISDDRITVLPSRAEPTIRFSLGQLESAQSAQTIAFTQGYRLLAKRIAEYIICNGIEDHENTSSH